MKTAKLQIMALERDHGVTLNDEQRQFLIDKAAFQVKKFMPLIEKVFAKEKYCQHLKNFDQDALVDDIALEGALLMADNAPENTVHIRRVGLSVGQRAHLEADDHSYGRH